jgi:hypothetical protein
MRSTSHSVSALSGRSLAGRLLSGLARQGVVRGLSQAVSIEGPGTPPGVGEV